MAYITNEIKTVEGTNITINDSDQKFINDLTLQGNTTQETTTGKNLWNYELERAEYNSSGTKVSTNVWLVNTTKINVIPNTQYTISQKEHPIQYRIVYFNGATYLNQVQNSVNTTTGYTSYTFTTPNNCNGVYIQFRSTIERIAKGTYTVEVGDITQAQLEKGSSATSYEPYTNGASPNPDYPQPINVVSGDNSIDVCGKNLMDNKAISGVQNGVAYTINQDKSITLNGTSTQAFIFDIDNGRTLEAGTYTLSLKGKILGCGIYLYENNTLKTYVSSNWTNDKNTFTLDKKTTFNEIRIDVQVNKTFNNITIYPMIEKGTTATTYEAYTGQSYEINLGKNLFDISTVDYTKKCTLSNEVYTTDALTTSARSVNFGYRANNNYIIYPNETYYVSADIRLVSGTATSVNVLALNASGTRSMIVNPIISSEFQRYLGSYTNNTNEPIQVGRTLFQPVNANLDNAVFEIKNVMISKSSDINYAPYKTPIELCKIGNYQDFIKKGTGKNLLDNSNTQIGVAWNNTSNTARAVCYVKVEPNKTYTTSLLGLGTLEGVYYFGKENTTDSTATMNVVSITTTRTFTTTATTNYIGIQYNKSSITQENVESAIVMLNEGNTALPYEPYGMYNKWYIEKNIGKVVLSSSMTWYKSGTTAVDKYYTRVGNWNASLNRTSYCNRFIYKSNCTNVGEFDYSQNGNYLALFFCYSKYNTSTINDFKTWLDNNEVYCYVPLPTPTYTEITDSELIGQLNAPRLLEGLNNVSVSSADLGSPIKISYYSTDNDYYDAIYSQDDRNDLKIWFNGVELENAPVKCEKITRVARILPNDGNKVFSLDNFISTSLEVILHNVDLEDIQDQVKISIGTLIDETNDTYEYIPLGVFNIQDTPTNDNGKITLKLRDNRVKFDFNYNAQPLIEEQGGSATKKQILDDICSQAGVTNTIDSFNGDIDIIGIYDNTIQASTYVSYLMEQAGLIPIIDRQGQLKAIDLTEPYIWKIPLSILETGFEVGEPYKIDRVVYESGIIKYETSSDETLDTLYLSAANPYISNQGQINYIFDKLQNFVIDSVITKNVLGNPAIDPYDLIKIYNDIDGTNDVVFETLANTTYTYNGKHRDIFDTQVSKEQRKENVSLKGEATFQKYAKALIDNLQGEITLEVGQVSGDLDALNKQLYGDEDAGITGDINYLGSQIQQKADGIEFQTYKGKVDDIETNGVNKVQTTSVLINNDGLNVSTSTSKISTTMTNNAFEIKDSGNTKLAYFGYDEQAGISKAEMNNLTVTNYFIAGNHRVEDYEEDGEHRTGWFYIGG